MCIFCRKVLGIRLYVIPQNLYDRKLPYHMIISLTHYSYIHAFVMIHWTSIWNISLSLSLSGIESFVTVPYFFDVLDLLFWFSTVLSAVVALTSTSTSTSKFHETYSYILDSRLLHPVWRKRTTTQYNCQRNKKCGRHTVHKDITLIRIV